MGVLSIRNKELFMKRLLLWFFWALFVGALYLAFDVPLELIEMREYYFGRWDFFGTFILFCIVILPVATLWLGLLLTRGNWRTIHHHIRLLIVFVAVMLAVSFTLFKWTSMINDFGAYGFYSKNGERYEELFRAALISKDASSYERETIYREFMEIHYSLTFKKIWTFDAMVFLSALLLLQVVPKRDERVI